MKVVDKREINLPLPQRLRKNRRKVIFISLLIFWTGFAFMIGAMSQKTGFFSSIARPIIEGGIKTPINYITSTATHPTILMIDMKFKHVQKFKALRNNALEKDALDTDAGGVDPWVPATIQAAGKSYKVEMRLKGDATDHLYGNKWSFRVKVNGEKSLMGMKRFSLHHPRARNYAHEWFYHQVMKQEGMIGLRYDFVELELNGNRLGVYALEEHFEKRLVENNKRREGPILRFSEDVMWPQLIDQVRKNPEAQTRNEGNYIVSEVDTFATNSVLKDPAKRKLFGKAAQLLSDWRRGQLTTSQVFDIDKTATYFALTDVLGAEHGSRWHNIRFYYNPVTSKIEPIAFDGNAGQPTKFLSNVPQAVKDKHGKTIMGYRNFNDLLFKDQALQKAYMQKIEKYSKQEWLQETFEKHDDQLDHVMNIVHREFPHLSFDRQVYYRNQEYIRSMLNPQKGVNANVAELNERQVTLDVGNALLMPVVLKELIIPRPDKVVQIDGKPQLQRQPPAILTPEKTTMLSTAIPGETVQYQKVTYVTQPGEPPLTPDMLNDVKLMFNIFGTAKLRSTPVWPFAQTEPTSYKNDIMRAEPNYQDYDIFTTRGNMIAVKPGKHIVKDTIIFPKTHTLTASAGVEINLVAGGKLISYAPLQFKGTVEQPIRIYSSDQKGQGLVVLQARERSKLEHVHFKDLAYPDHHGWMITGSVTFYESDVDLLHCHFVDNHSEDGLNIVRANFLLDGCLIKNTFSDAFDADFCEGKVLNTRFENAGNDGIDVSTATIYVENVTVDKSGDKAISTGEQSDLIAKNITIKDAFIALASKDKSRLYVQGAKLDNCKYVVAAFQKKPEFGPAHIKVENMEMTNMADAKHLLEVDSTAVINGKPYSLSEAQDIKRILYADEPARYIPPERR